MGVLSRNITTQITPKPSERELPLKVTEPNIIKKDLNNLEMSS